MFIEGASTTMMTLKKCPICGKFFKEFGNNPEPVMPMEEGKCCNSCDRNVVIPTRMFISKKIEEARGDTND